MAMKSKASSVLNAIWQLSLVNFLKANCGNLWTPFNTLYKPCLTFESKLRKPGNRTPFDPLKKPGKPRILRISFGAT